MLESYIKLNQDINKKSQKLKEIDERLNELNKLKVHMSNLKENPSVSLAYSRMGSQVNTDTAVTPSQPTDEGAENIRPTTSRMLSEQSASSRVIYTWFNIRMFYFFLIAIYLGLQKAEHV